jgi:uncharacterized protein YuzE
MPSRTTYDPTSNAAYIYLRDIAEGEAVAQVKVKSPAGERIILDFDAEHRLIGIEVLGAETTLPATLLAEAELPTEDEGALLAW